MINQFLRYYYNIRTVMAIIPIWIEFKFNNCTFTWNNPFISKATKGTSCFTWKAVKMLVVSLCRWAGNPPWRGGLLRGERLQLSRNNVRNCQWEEMPVVEFSSASFTPKNFRKFPHSVSFVKKLTRFDWNDSNSMFTWTLRHKRLVYNF